MEYLKIIKTVLTIIFAIDCIVLTTLVLSQEGKSGGLGAISGGSDSFWGQNKARSKEGKMVLATRIAAILFILLAVALNLSVFA